MGIIKVGRFDQESPQCEIGTKYLAKIIDYFTHPSIKVSSGCVLSAVCHIQFKEEILVYVTPSPQVRSPKKQVGIYNLDGCT